MGEYQIIDMEIDLKGSVPQFSESAYWEVVYEDIASSSPEQKSLQFPLTLKDQALTLSTAVKLTGPMKIIYEKISSPEDIFSCILNDGRTFRPGQTAFRTLNSQNDKMALGLSGTSVAMEYASFGEGQIRPGPSAEGADRYYYLFMLADHLGSTRMVVMDKGDQLTEAVLYAPYGKMVGELASSAEKDVREKFTGKEYDSDGSGNGGTGIGLFYFGARYYDADVGRWVSVDPHGQYYDLYLYGGNNPVNRLDSDGRDDFGVVEQLMSMPRSVSGIIRWNVPQHEQQAASKFITTSVTGSMVAAGVGISCVGGFSLFSGGATAVYADAVFVHSSALTAWGSATEFLAANWGTTVGIGLLSGMILNQLPSVENTPGLNDVLSLYFPTVGNVANLTDQTINFVKELDFSWVFPNNGGIENLQLDMPEKDYQ